MGSVQANGITIEYEEQGSGEPLLLIMGLGGQLVDWPQGLIDQLLDRGFRVIRFDNRDIGLSTEFDGVAPPTRGQLAKAITVGRPMPASYLLHDMAADAVGLLDALGIGRAHVVGMSMGGMIAQQIAIDFPERVSSLVSIMSTTGSRRVGRPTAKVARMSLRRPAVALDESIDRAVEFFREISGSRFDEAEFREMAKADYERSFRPEGMARQLAAIIASGDRTAALQQLDVPTLVVHGLADTLVRPSGGIATAKAIPDSRLLMFNDMGHDFPNTRHAEIAEAIARNAVRAGAPVAAGV
jgi:pimeloyl-ACP methyl ester carboxylesterase